MKHYLNKVMLFAVAALISVSCSSEFPGFKKTDNGLYYKFHESTDCDLKPKVGDLISFDMKVYSKDTVYSEPYPVNRQQMDTSVYPGDLYEAMSMMCAGDSATFILSGDSLTKYYGMDEMGLAAGSLIYVDLRMREIFTVAQQDAETDSLMKAEMALFEVYQADSLQDFIELSPGVFYKEVVAGKGLMINDTSMISLKIKGIDLNGEVFFPEEEKPLNFRITDQTGIPFNWNDALRRMKEGGKGILVLTSPNAFGKRGFSMGNIGPYQTVKLELTVLKVAASALDFERFTINDYVKRNKITQKPSSDGLYHITNEKGEGGLLKSGDRVMVHYVGKYLDNNSVFDSSHQRGQPIEVVIDETEVIAGWHAGLKKMKVGEKATLIIPSSLGYGASGYPPVIGPFAPLVFEMEVVAKL